MIRWWLVCYKGEMSLREGSSSEFRSLSWYCDADLFTVWDGSLFCMFFSLMGLLCWRGEIFTWLVSGPVFSTSATVRRSLTVFCSRAEKTALVDGNCSGALTCVSPLLAGEDMEV